MNQIILIGRLTADPHIKYLNDDPEKPVAEFALAVDRDLSKAQKAKLVEQGKKTTDYFDCVLYGKGADTVSKWCGKGLKLAVSGPLQVDAKKDKAYIKVQVKTFEILEFKGEATANNTQKAQNQTPSYNDFRDVEDDSDLPF